MSANRVQERRLHAVLAQQDEAATKSPIKQVIIIVGENRSFRHIVATYKPKNGENVDNLLSKGILSNCGSALLAPILGTDSDAHQHAHY